MGNRLNDKNFGTLMIGIIIFTRLFFYQNFQGMFLTLKYVAVFAGLFFHKFETYHKKVYAMPSINKALNPFAPVGQVINTDVPSNNNISKIIFLMICRLIDFALVVL